MKIYYAYLSDFSQDRIESFIKFLPEEKKEKLVSVKNQKSRNESILGWYLLHKALLEKGILDYKISYGEHSKPYLCDTELFFNLSHSNDMVCCAVSEREVGIDAEKIKPVKDSLINKVLTEKERLCLKDKDSDFIRFWTLKESYLNNSGSGITSELYSLDFFEKFRKDEFSLFSLLFTVKMIGDYYISVCSDEKEREFIRVTE